MAQITAMVPVAEAVGSNRIVRACGIVYPVGDAGLSPEEELELRRRLVREALDALRGGLEQMDESLEGLQELTEGGSAP